jgi:transposase-like protein
MKKGARSTYPDSFKADAVQLYSLTSSSLIADHALI